MDVEMIELTSIRCYFSSNNRRSSAASSSSIFVHPQKKVTSTPFSQFLRFSPRKNPKSPISLYQSVSGSGGSDRREGFDQTAVIQAPASASPWRQQSPSQPHCWDGGIGGLSSPSEYTGELPLLHQRRNLRGYASDGSASPHTGSCAWLPPPPPPNNGSNVVILENLHTLIGMVGLHLNEDVVRRLANLTILGVSYVNKIEKRGEVHCFSYLQRLSKLECFRCSFTDDVNDDLETISFPQSLKQIHLVRNGSTFDKKIELEGMLQKLGWLPVLEEVVIQNGFFERDEWETEGQFPRLKILELGGYGNLRKWTLPEGSSHFPLLEKLILYEFRKLEEIPSEIGEIATLKLIDVSYCCRSIVLSAKKMVEEQEELYGEDELSFQVRFRGLYYDSHLASLVTPNFQVKFF